jgi:hypothetical protein
MAYTPPSGDAVNFNATIPIIIPLCNAVNFNISATDIRIDINSSVINIFDSDFFYVAADVIIPEITVLKLYTDPQLVNPVTVIGIPSSILNIHYQDSDVEPLPDVLMIPSVIMPMTMEQLVGGNREFDLPVGLSIGAVVNNWEKTTFVTEHTKINWENAITVDEFNRLVADDATIAESELIDISWKVMEHADIKTDIHVSAPLTFVDCITNSLWNQFYVVDEFNKICWDSFLYADRDVVVYYKQPPPKDTEKLISWESMEQVTDTLVINWNSPGAKDKRMIVPWGPVSYFAYCSTRYFPPEADDVNFKLEPFDPALAGICMNITFDVEGVNTDPRCPYSHYQTGTRDPYNGGGYPVDVHYPYNTPIKEQYYMLNTVLVKRLPDNAPIEVTSISITYDKQSWLWSFSLTIGKDKNRYLDLIKPNPLNADIFTDIEIYINGWKWICRVESWNESRVFAKDSWTITGRSPSMELGYPQNPKTSYIYDPSSGTSSTAGAQIMEDVLEGTMLGLPDKGWVVDWTAYTGTPEIHTGFDPFDASYWGIPDGSFSWTDKTQIEVIKSLTESIGAFIITNPYCTGADKKLIIRPKYDQPPWYWNTANIHRPLIDHVINTSYSTEVGRNYAQLANYDSVYVMGQKSTDAQKTNVTDGIVIVETFRDGVGPGSRVYGEDIVNPYLYNWQAAFELGRMSICETGEWMNHRLRLFSIAEYTDPAPKISRLILPGDFVQVNEDSTSWYGLASSVEINVSIVNTSVFAVYQTIEVNQYIGA